MTLCIWAVPTGFRFSVVTTLISMALFGCGGNASNPLPPEASRSLGLVEITIGGLASGHGTTAARSAQPGVAAKALMSKSAGVDMEPLSVVTVDVGTRGSGGMRYSYVTYRIRNAAYCATPGTCTPYSQPLNNLTLLGAATSSSLNQTAVTSLKHFDGSDAAPALATQIAPTHGMQGDGNGTGVVVVQGLESLQIYSESEIASLAPSAGVTSIFPYGYVARNVTNPSSRMLPANPEDNQFDGLITIAFRIPLQANAADDPNVVSFLFQIVDDSGTRVTQSQEEQSAAGDAAAGRRAAALSSSDLVVLGGRVAQTNIGDPICAVRTAGTAAVPTTYLVSNGGPTVGSAPFGLAGLPPAGSLVAGFCAPMNAATFVSWVIWGRQSGMRTAGGPYTGSYGGGGNHLGFTPDAAHPFFPGEQVFFSLTSNLTSSSSQALARPFVGSFLAGGLQASSAVFAAEGAVTTGNSPTAIVEGDFDSDGKPDFAVTNINSNTVSVLFGNGRGGFRSARKIAMGTYPYALAAGDFNGDGKLDLAVTNSGDNTVSLLLGNGAGGFTTAASGPVSAGTLPYAMTAGDFNNDGRLDLAVASYRNNTLTILLGNGAGGFTPTAGPVATGATPFGITAADLNGDGKLDLAVANYNSKSVSILLGNGAGGFTATGNPLAVGANPKSVVAGDFNNDGHVDLAIANYGGNSVTVLLGNGVGSFSSAAASPYMVGINPQSMVVGDFNGDGKRDVAVTNRGSGTVSILLGNGGGGFAAANPISVGTTPYGIAAGDFNRDGRMDLAIANTGSNNASILLGSGDGSFSTTRAAQTGNGPRTTAVGDFNGDGKLDLAVTNASDNTVSVFLGTGTGNFAPAAGSPFAAGIQPIGITAIDFNADGKLDLAVANAGSNTVSILLGNGSGGFTATSPSPTGNYPVAVASGDFNGDGLADLVVGNFNDDTVSVLLGDGAGGFAITATVPVGHIPRAFAITDFNGDGKLDFAVANQGGDSVSILLGSGDGTFTAAASSPVTVGTTAKSVASGDFNGDGKPDLVVTNQGSNTLSILLGKGDGSFGPASTYTAGNNPRASVVGDFNGDGKLDLAVVNQLSFDVLILLGDGTGRFSLLPDSSVAVGTNPEEITAGDFTGDGKLDLVVTNYSSNNLSILIGQ